jgi:hypothetical protein
VKQAKSGTRHFFTLLIFVFVALYAWATRRMARGGHGLIKVSLGPVMPDHYMPCQQATPEMDLQPFQGWPTCRAGGPQPSSTLLDIPYRTPKVTGHKVCYLFFFSRQNRFTLEEEIRKHIEAYR